MQMTNWKNWAVGGVAALAIMAGGLYAADSVSAAAPVTGEIESMDASVLALANAEANQFGRGPRNDAPGARAGINGDALLADALGISEEDLQAARDTAKSRAADEAIAQAVADGKLTQEQADAFKTLQGLGNGRLMQRIPMSGNYDAYLAEALGITEDQLADARVAAHEAGIAQAVADGTITQEQADEMLAHMELRDYVQPQMEAAFESAVQSAVADGVITQEQADEILSQDKGFGRGTMDGRHGFSRGMRGDMGDGMRGGGHDGRMQGEFPGKRGGDGGQGFGLNSQSDGEPQLGPGSQL